MDNILLGPFSFITDEDNIKKPEYLKKMIERTINKNKKLDIVSYEIKLLETPLYFSGICLSKNILVSLCFLGSKLLISNIEFKER